jgi:hypothetical protein
MPDGCKHIPAMNLAGFEVSSFISGPHCTHFCELAPACDSSHVFIARNLHLYEVAVTADASSDQGHIEVCDEAEDAAKRTSWRMTRKVPAAPYRPPRGTVPYSEVELSTDVHSAFQNARGQGSDFIDVDYAIDSPVNGLMRGMRFYVVVQLS